MNVKKRLKWFSFIIFDEILHIMKKIYLLVTLCFVLNAFSQYNENTPWSQQSKTIQKEKEQTFEELVNSFEEYWINKDFSTKGSGYKPFKRWENFWKDQLNNDGRIMRSGQLWSAWKIKNQTKNNSRSSLSLPNSNWTPIGPFTHSNTGSWSSGQGRVQVVCVDPSNANTIYVGAPAGGIWKSTNAGNSWTPLSDNLPQIGVSGIAVDYSNPNIIYIATGDKDSSNTYSVGVLKSTDGGLTWNTTGLSFLGENTLAGDLMINPTNSQVLLCATSDGLFKTTDAGDTWINTNPVNCVQGSLRFKHNNSNIVYLTSYDTFFRSTDGGTTFSSITTGLPASSTRLLLDVTNADSNYIYILSADAPNINAVPPYYGFQGVYLSVNGGDSFTKTARNSDIFESRQAYYDLALGVSQTDKNTLFTGCLNVWKSTDAGSNFLKLSSWNNPSSVTYTHADIHFIQIFGNKTYIGSDGGVYVSSDDGNTFTSKTDGLQISQFYKISVSKQTASKMVGGLQDNGGHAYSGGAWKNYYGADGMDTAIDPLNSDKFYGFIQNGGSLYVSTNAGNSNASGIGKPSGETGNWVTPLGINSQGELFAGYKKLYRLVGSSWVQQQSATTNLGTSNLELIIIDPSNDNIMYVVNGTKLYKSLNKGETFTNVYTAFSNITSVCVNYSNSNIIYITRSGTTGDVLKSINGGTTFTAFSTGLPNISKNVVRHQGRNSLNPLFLGTTLGVYYIDDSMTQWEPFDNNLPNVSVTDLEINIEDSILVAATYGRGIWQTVIPFEIPTNDIKLVSIQSPSRTIACENSISPEIIVKNIGSNPVTSVNINYDYNGALQNYIWTGSILPNNSQIINLPSISPSRGAYNLNVNSTISADTYLDNNQGSAPFYVNDAGLVGVINAFETPSSSLLTANEGSATSLWKRGVNTNGALATSNSAYTTNFSGNYPDNVKSYIYSQCYNLTNAVNPQIKFDLAFDLELNWDIVYVEYSTNMGSTWSTLGEQGPNWYNSNRTNASSGASDDCQNCPGAQWTGTNTTLTNYSYSLNNLIGQSNVIFRIIFHSDEAANQLGVVVDNFGIDGTLSNQEFELQNIAIYPNPSAGLFTISTGDKAIEKLEVYDVTGKIVYSANDFSKVNSENVLNLSNASSGIYFVKLTSEDQSTVKRIIKN
jgi:Secretion system C-terminal sorting domain